MDKPTPCLICGSQPWPILPESASMQPRDAVMFSASGNFGSAVFDEEDGSSLEGNICDDCTVEAYKQGRLVRIRRPVCHHDVEIIRWDIE